MRLFTSRLSVQANTWKLPITHLWSKVSGPGPVVFQTPNAPNCNVSFSVLGSYVIRVSATDGVFTTHDDSSVLVAAAAIPIVNAGGDQTKTLPVNTAVMAASASDPEGAPLTYAWTQISGISGPTFSNATALNPTITFPNTAGVFVFRLTVSNGIHSAFDDIQVTTNPAAVGPNPGIVNASLFTDVYHQNSPGTLRVVLGSNPTGLGLCTITLTIPSQLGVYDHSVFTRDSSNWFTSEAMVTTTLPSAGTFSVNWSVVSANNPVPTTGSFNISVQSSGGGES